MKLPRVMLISECLQACQARSWADDSIAALGFARKEARTLQHEYIGTEHLLLGLIGNSNCTAARVLQQQNRDAMTMIRMGIEKLMMPPTAVPPEAATFLDDPVLTPRAMSAVTTATDLATDQLNWNEGRAGSEHILLALLSDEETVAYQLLANRGIEFDRSRDVARGLVKPA
jgi:ATP-dependent Clp protease ATP-binding subunit ClpC